MIKKVKVIVEILMDEDDDVDGWELSAIEREAMGGSWSKTHWVESETTLTKEEVIEECEAHGTDPDFFALEMEDYE